MAAAELVAFVHFQPGAGGAVEQGGAFGRDHVAGADHQRGTAAGDGQRPDQRRHFGFRRAADDGADTIGDDQLGPSHHICRQLGCREIRKEIGKQVEVAGVGMGLGVHGSVSVQGIAAATGSDSGHSSPAEHPAASGRVATAAHIAACAAASPAPSPRRSSVRSSPPATTRVPPT